MKKLRVSYLVAIAIIWCLNGAALLQHLSILSGVEGFVAATLLINMLAAPLVIWIAFVYGELAEEEMLRGKRAKGAPKARGY